MDGETPVSAVLNKRGQTKKLDLAPKPSFEQVNDGQTIQFYDPLSKKSAGSFQRQMTPGEVDTSKRGWEQVALSRNADRRAADAANADKTPKAPAGYRWTADGKSLEHIAGGPADPSQAGKAPTEQQGNAIMFGMRAVDTHKRLAEMEKTFDPTSIGAGKDSVTAGKLATNWMASAQGQAYFNTAKNFVAATLRKESGAQITDSEWTTGIAMYIPMYGDDAKTLEGKRRNRELVIDGMKAVAGPHSGQIPSLPSAGATGSFDIDPAAVDAEMRRRGLKK
jgi:hypothetical protein